MNKKFKAELMDRLLQARIPGAAETPDWQRGYDAAMMEIARFVNGWKSERKKEKP